MTSNACRICVYGQERAAQLVRMTAFFDTLDVHLVSPSDAALSFWKSRTELLPASVRVQPHVTLKRIKATPPNNPDPAAATRIAFVGTPAPHKGWPVFTELQKRLSADAGYAFYYFGAEKPINSAIHHVGTHVRSADPDAVSQAIPGPRHRSGPALGVLA